MYEDECGDRTVLVMQVGTFYEIYFLEEDAKNAELPRILGSRLTLKNTRDIENAGTLKNPFMMGFPCVTYDDRKYTILSNNYVFVSYKQNPKCKTERILFEKETPLTSNDVIIKNDIKSTNQICCIYVQSLKYATKIENVALLVGISSIDIVTGNTYTQEIHTDTLDSRLIINEIYRYLCSTKPKELQIYINYTSNKVNPDVFEKYLFDNLELDTYPIINLSRSVPKDFLNVNYQEQYLNKIFRGSDASGSGSENLTIKLPRGAILDIFTILGIERYQYATVSYILLLQYCYSHNETLISKIKRPTVGTVGTVGTTEGENLILTHNAAIQLNIVSPNISKINYRINKRKNRDTLLGILDSTNTLMGRRMLRNTILNPICNPTILQDRYNLIEFLINNDDLRKKSKLILKQLYDIEFLGLKLVRESISPKDLCNLISSYRSIVELINVCIPYLKTSGPPVVPSSLFKFFPKQVDLITFNNFISVTFGTFDLEILSECNLMDDSLTCNGNPLRLGISPECDQLQAKVLECSTRLEMICEHLESVLGVTKGSTIDVKSFSKKVNKTKSLLEGEDETIINMKDLGIYLTKAKADKLKKSLNSVNVQLCGEITISSRASKFSVNSTYIDSLCDTILTSRNRMSQILYDVYKRFLNYSASQDLSKIVNFVINLDLGICNADNAIEYRYFKPAIEMVTTEETEGANKVGGTGGSYLEIKDARHPLVERIIDTEYISNDVTLNSSGILLYGCNSTGKTVLTTSIGLIIIMAQAGMWVPGHLKFNPYKRIITRLSGQDDVLKGHSSFVVEMLELRTILRNSDQFTLILGDELCRGTESLSGSALTISTLEWLISKKSSFIFSTHLHDIPSKSRVKKLCKDETLKIFHLETTYNTELETLVYNRKIKEGSGESIYGLEVAKSLDIDPEFINNALAIRRELKGESVEFLNPKKSKYNSEVNVDSCGLCKTVLSLESHHIREQSKADSNGFIGNVHKNSQCNIFVLCRSCHQNLHHKGFTLSPLQTPNGIVLQAVKDSTDSPTLLV
jgi:DNA mismatch repair protein MutS